MSQQVPTAQSENEIVGPLDVPLSRLKARAVIVSTTNDNRQVKRPAIQVHTAKKPD